jgi:hypothetical protein
MNSELIKPNHLDRKAVVYLRQSSPHQVSNSPWIRGAPHSGGIRPHCRPRDRTVGRCARRYRRSWRRTDSRHDDQVDSGHDVAASPRVPGPVDSVEDDHHGVVHLMHAGFRARVRRRRSFSISATSVGNGSNRSAVAAAGSATIFSRHFSSTYRGVRRQGG